MDWLTKQPIAHRGLHKGFTIPENSLCAFQKAIDKNYTIELDVRITKDEKIVVFHDKNLLRLCGINKKISNQLFDNIKDIKLFQSSQSIPLLKDVLDLIDGKVPIIIEIKNYGKVGRFETLLAKQLDLYKGKYAICSFNDKVIEWFGKNRPNILKGLIYGDLHKFSIKYYKTVFLFKMFNCKPDFISLDYKLINTSLPTICKLFNKTTLCWTINSKKKRRRAIQKIDNIIFENFDLGSLKN